MPYEKYIENICDKCKSSSSVALSDVLKNKSPNNGIPAGWKYVGDFVDYCPYFLLCSDCVSKWNRHLQGEIERFVK